MVSRDRRDACGGFDATNELNSAEVESLDAANESFDDWLSRTCSPPENFSFAQYGRYAEGWRQSKPWAWKGMSIRYDRWAESRWSEVRSRERLKDAWKLGLAIKSKALFTKVPGWAVTATVEECADFELSFQETLAGLCLLAVSNFDIGTPAERLEHAGELAEFLAARIPAALSFEMPR